MRFSGTPRTSALLSVEDYREAARQRLPRIAYDYLERGAEDEVSYRANRAAFAELEFNPRTLREIGDIDLSVQVLGERSRLPIVVGPTGFAGLFWPEADKALARAAGAAGIPFVLSTAATSSIEAVAPQGGAARRWYQLYILNDRSATADMVARAAAAGYGALVLTVDTVCSGKREASLRHGSRLPLKLDLEKLIDFALHPRWSLQMLRHGQPNLANFPNPRKQAFVMEAHLKRQIGWGDVEWLRSRWDGPVVLKGIQSVEDARLAAAAGVDGIVLSNHGGRQLDGSPAPMRLLPEVAAAVGANLEVMIDGGFRRGSDIVKALALGAKSAWLGRPALYGVACAGEQGAARVLAILEDELKRTLTLLGVDRADRIDDSVLRLPGARSALSGLPGPARVAHA